MAFVATLLLTAGPNALAEIYAPPTSTGDYTVSWDPVEGARFYILIENGQTYDSYFPETTAVSFEGKITGSYVYRVQYCHWEDGAPSYYCDWAGGAVMVEVNNSSTPTEPGPVSGPATNTTGVFTLSWSPASGTFERYEVVEQPSERILNPSPENATTITVTVVGEGNYTYAARACRSGGRGCGELGGSHQVDVKFPPPAPDFPENSGVSTGDYDLWWTGRSPDLDIHELEEQVNGGAFGPAPGSRSAEPIYNSPTWLYNQHITGKPTGTYGYRVRACHINKRWSCSEWKMSTVEVETRDNIVPAPSIEAVTSAGTIPFSTGISNGGDALVNVPLLTPTGVQGVDEFLALSYSSGGGERSRQAYEQPGVLGYGWSLRGFSMIRRCRMLVGGSLEWNTADRLCLDGMPLKVVAGDYWAEGAEYRTYPNTMVKVVAKGSYSQRWFEVFLPNGRKLKYGNTGPSRVVGAVVYEFHTWALTEEVDEFGNKLTIDWSVSRFDRSNYPLSISYNDSRIDFFYQLRDPGPGTPMGAGSISRQSVLLNTVRIKRGANVLREYRLIYGDRLSKVQQCAYDESGSNYRCLAPLSFEWTLFEGWAEDGSRALTSVDNGLGEVTHFEYAFVGENAEEPAADQGWFGTYTQPSNVVPLPANSSRLIVKGSRVPNGRGGHTRYGFAHVGFALYDHAGLGYVGFPVTEMSVDVPAYDAATGTSGTVTLIERRQHRLDRGMYGRIARSESSLIRNGTRALISRQEFDWQLGSNDLALLPRVYNWHYELTSTGTSQWHSAEVVTTEYCFNNLSTPSHCPGGINTEFPGQVTVQVDSGQSLSPDGTQNGSYWGSIGSRSTGTSLTQRALTTNLSNSVSPWTVGFAHYTRQKLGAGTARTINSTAERLNAGSLRAASTTLMPGDSQFELTRAYAYNAQGNLTGETISGSNITTRSVSFGDYAANNHLVPRTVTNAKSQTTTLTYDTRFNTPKTLLDANGLTTTVERDEFGRVIKVTGSDGSVTEMQYENCNFSLCGMIDWGQARLRATITQRNGVQIAPTTRVYLDGLGRELLSETEAFNSANGWTRVATQYDAAGRLSGTSAPYFSVGGTPSWQSILYDDRSHTVRITRSNGTTLTSTYSSTALGELTVTTTDSANNQTKEWRYNALGQLSQTTDGVGTSDAVSATYSYTPEGDLDIVQVNGVQMQNFDYDAAGYRNRITDPHAGTTEITYDALGQPRTRTDAKGSITHYTFDLLGRLTQRIDAHGTSNAVTNTFEWDTKPYGKGALSSRSNGQFTEIFSYDSLGRLSSSTTTTSVSGFTATGSYQTTFGYDSQGRLSTVTYPGNITFTNQYTARGYLEAMKQGSTVLEQYNQTDAFGNITQASFANGLTTSRVFDPKTGDLTAINTGTSSAPKSIQDLEYKWKSDGMLEWRADRRGTSSTADDLVESFTYDNLNRLDRASAVVPNVTTRTRTQDYDLYGNLTLMQSTVPTDRSLSGNSYAPVSGDKTFFAYNSHNQATRITVGATENTSTPTARDEFWYDPDGSRFLRKESWSEGTNQHSRWVLYLMGGTFEEVQTPNDSTVEYYQKVQVTGTVQYRLTKLRSGSTQVTYDYIHRDHLGSADRITNASGSIVHRLSYDPFGLRRESNWSSDATVATMNAIINDNSTLTNRGFTDHEHLDRTGFIHMNGRLYDPRIGRFVQPDPFVQDPTNTQSYNRYSYVFNSPLSYTDPSGFEANDFDEEEHCRSGSADLPPNQTLGSVCEAVLSQEWYRWMVQSDVNATKNMYRGPFVDSQIVDGARAVNGPSLIYQSSDGTRYTIDYEPPYEEPLRGGIDSLLEQIEDVLNGGCGRTLTCANFRLWSRFRAARLAPGSVAANAIDDLAKLRASLGLKEGEGTLARLDYNGRSFYGINAHGQQVTLRVNPISATHAEADVFQQAFRAGVRGTSATLYVDRALCASCGLRGAVVSMARQLGVMELRIVTPKGVKVIRIVN